MSSDFHVVIWTYLIRQNVIWKEKCTKIGNMLYPMIYHIVNRRVAVTQDLYFLVLPVQFSNVQVYGGTLVIAQKCTLSTDVVLLELVVRKCLYFNRNLSFFGKYFSKDFYICKIVVAPRISEVFYWNAFGTNLKQL